MYRVSVSAFCTTDGKSIRILSADSKASYTSKVVRAGLKDDPFAISSESWVAEPDTFPNVAWSDMFMYMISLSPYTQQEVIVWYCAIGYVQYICR